MSRSALHTDAGSLAEICSFNLASLSHFDFLCQCVTDLIVQGPVTTSVGVLLGLMKMLQLRSEPRFIVHMYLIFIKYTNRCI